MSRYYLFFDVRLQFYDMAPYWAVLKNGIWKNAPRIEIESAPWNTPTRFFLKLLLYWFANSYLFYFYIK